MKTVERTAKKITIEATQSEMDQKGFDALWDEIREVYVENLYEVDNIEESEDKKIITIKLKLKKY